MAQHPPMTIDELQCSQWMVCPLCLQMGKDGEFGDDASPDSVAKLEIGLLPGSTHEDPHCVLVRCKRHDRVIGKIFATKIEQAIRLNETTGKELKWENQDGLKGPIDELLRSTENLTIRG